MTRKWTSVFALTLIAVALQAASAGAGTESATDVEIGKRATLLDGGQAVLLEVEVSCRLGNREVLEAFAYLSQDGVSSDFGFIPVRCGGQPRTYLVVAEAFEGTTFHAGTAQASAFVLILDRSSGETEQGSATETIELR